VFKDTSKQTVLPELSAVSTVSIVLADWVTVLFVTLSVAGWTYLVGQLFALACDVLLLFCWLIYANSTGSLESFLVSFSSLFAGCMHTIVSLDIHHGLVKNRFPDSLGATKTITVFNV
jgi:hypothetical protein